ncbi:surfeit locus protein 6-domain-containing protein [Lasiosphaeria hispida]|uniref:Surfeit locus protein 6-domain-containing protein n=1 Tax=Lasiosphaeria hispida TaxID=260671 RepID=A0AAJ0MAV9_9PEZI|nr:surfeit locus protein 6-domain-containing protein [Lasiosphaeria hispida]
MAESTLQDRLRDHAKAFDGLMSLIPAKMYYGEEKEKSEQWMKKKQTKDQAKAAKRGKLDPDSELNRNAKEVLEERARNKRKLKELEAEDESDEEEEEEDDASLLAGIEKERPGEGQKKKKEKKKAITADDEPPPKKPKVADPEAEVDAEVDAAEEKEAATPSKKVATKEERKLAKKLKKEEKDKKKAAKGTPAGDEAEVANSLKKQPTVKSSTEVDADQDELVPIDVSGLVGEDEEGASAESAEESTPQSPVFDNSAKNASAEAASTTTSVSSTIPPSEKPRYIKIPADTTNLRARLAERIEAMRANRKAIDEEGNQIRTRQELIESRREKQLQRRAHKREMRQKAKEEEDQKREEVLASSRNSPMSVLSPIFNDPDDDRSANNFAFGRLAFSDGTQMSHDLSYAKTASDKKKGPSDPKTALAKLEAQKLRVAGLEEDKRKEVLEKEVWLAARRRTEGEKVLDSESLLKKAIKRKEKTKQKSERQWKERAQGVEKGMKDRARKREENIQKRKDGKGVKGKGKKKAGPTKPKNRPGFEGGGFGAPRGKK